ncbi:DUF4145 domain-containing protein [Agrobacterium sp. Ap1]|uniref:DUF4145 domain-containing protein n=1 Tax=Agrobacterium sp. Ap1 TaxID=2815337 RepID=UPI001A8BFF2C|nr:DUF4145 domain-containing protein [Agrobacterium sp. Ap1]MBO0141586.1 DUF4145 domain-containing protein [Agrobacterium sp. Ap1]
MANIDGLNAEVFFICKACGKGSIYQGQPASHISNVTGELDRGRYFDQQAIIALPDYPIMSEDIPDRVRDLFRQAVRCRQLSLFDAAGAMFRKTIDVATKEIYTNDPRLSGKKAADAPRARVVALGQLKVLDEDIVELADVALMDGNDAAHDVDPYTSIEAEALQDLTDDLLDRLFVKPARIARVKAKQIESGQRRAQ